MPTALGGGLNDHGMAQALQLLDRAPGRVLLTRLFEIGSSDLLSSAPDRSLSNYCDAARLAHDPLHKLASRDVEFACRPGSRYRCDPHANYSAQTPPGVSGLHGSSAGGLPEGKDLHVILDNYWIHKRNDPWFARIPPCGLPFHTDVSQLAQLG